MDNHLPSTRQEGTKKHNLYNLKTGDKQEAVHMQMAAGREHRQSDRSRNSSWMEISLPKERWGEDRGRAEHSGQGKILRKRYCSTSTTTTLPQNVRFTQRCALCFYFNPRRTLGFSALERNCFYCSPCLFWAVFSMSPLPHLDFRACRMATEV